MSAETWSGRLATIVAIALREPEVEARTIARREILALSARDLRSLAIEEVASEIDHYRRAEARRVEAEAAALAAYHAERREEFARRERFERERIAAYRSWRDDPGQLSWDMESGYPSSTERKRFVRWLGDGYEAWYAKLTERCGEFVQGDFHVRGTSGFYAEKRSIAVGKMLDEVAEMTRLEVTKELMETLFALGDGTRVTWGEATITQHEQRLAMLTGNIEGLADTAARHRRAIEMIQEAGVTSLRELSNAETCSGSPK